MTTKLLGNLRNGILFVVSAPAGTGKTTLATMLAREFPCIISSISFTTRAPREGEVDGDHYNFVSKKEFEEKIEGGDFLEYVTLYGNYYGTSLSWIREKQKEGKHLVLVINTEGALRLMEREPIVSIFIKPPSLEELRRRLELRQTETKEVIEERLAWVKHELEAIPRYDYCIVNDHLETAYQVLKSIFIAEEHRVKRLLEENLWKK